MRLARWLRQLRRRWGHWSRRRAARRAARRRLGPRGERAARRWLRRAGLRVVAQGLRNRLGELDLVAVEGREIVFIEVKTRRTHAAGHPSEAVDRRKQRQLTRLALAYLKRHDLLECRMRFDIVAITWPREARRPTIEHYRAAFEPEGRGQMFS